MDEKLRKIWWIASFPKSGNTLVRMFINAYVSGMPLDINAAFQYACVDQIPLIYQHVASKPLTKLDPAEYAYLRPAMLMNYLQMIHPRDACFKTHNANVRIDGIPLIPQRLTKQAVYLVRDPRDVAVSYARHSKKTIDSTVDILSDNAHHGKRDDGLQDVIMSWSNHVISWDKAKFPVYFVKFEDLILDKAKTFRSVLYALGLRDIEQDKFDFAMNQTSFENLRNLEKKEGFRESKGDTFFGEGNYEEKVDGKSRIGQWKEKLTDKQVRKIEKDHSEIMKKFGYI